MKNNDELRVARLIAADPDLHFRLKNMPRAVFRTSFQKWALVGDMARQLGIDINNIDKDELHKILSIRM